MDSKVKAGSPTLFPICISEPETPGAADPDTVVVDRSGRGDFTVIREAAEAARGKIQ